ncbi:MAG: GlcG/HbpS family heme-binding protein [Methylophilaceae bacterium]
MNKNILMACVLATLGVSQVATAACSDLVPVLRGAVDAATTANNDGGYPLNFWVTAVDETGKVCAVVTNGVVGATAGNSEWLGSRVISAQKANTANAFSLDAYAISTANLYSAVQPGGSLFGLQESNPVNAEDAYEGPAANFGRGTLDPMVGKRIGGVNVFGGGLALYKGGKKVGAVGVSGDTSCADHVFAWNVRDALNMEPSDGQKSGLAAASPSGFVGITTVNFNATGTLTGASLPVITGATQGDEMVIKSGTTASYWDAWAHPACPNTTGLNGSSSPAVLFF